MKQTLLSILIFLFVCRLSASDVIDSLEKAAESSQGSEKISALTELASQYLRRDPQKGLVIIQKADSLARTASDSTLLANTQRVMGVANFYLGNQKSALDHFINSFEISKKLNDEKSMAYSSNNIGIIYQNRGNFEKALDYYLKALKINEKLGDDKGAAFALNNIGIIHHQRNNYKKALAYFNRALDLNEKMNDRPGVARALNNLGSTYEELGDYEKALEIHKNSLEIKKELDDNYGIAKSLNNIGVSYGKLGMPQKALQYCTKSLSLHEELSDKHGIAISANSLANIYLGLGRIEKARTLFLKSLDIARKHNHITLQQENYSGLAEADEKLGNFAMALKYYKKYSEVKDSIRSDESSKRMEQLQMSYETAKTEKEIEALKAQRQADQFEIERQIYMRNILIAAVIAVLIIIVLIYIQYRTKSKANKLLEAKSNEIEKQKDETEKLNTMLNEKNSDLEQAIVKIKKSESQLRQTNETKNKFFSIIAHDLKNPLTSLLSSTSLLARHFSALSEQEIKDYITRLNKSSRQMHELVDNLFQWAMSQVGKMEFLPEKTDLHDLISSVILSQKSSADYKNIAIENNINQECIAFVDGNMIRAVVRNLISNSIKFTEPGGTISISCRDDVKFQKIRICDTGIGIPPDKIDQIFMPDNKISTPGTMNEKGSGLGLMLCHEFIKRNGGIIKAENSKGQGACFTFTVPKSMI